MNYSIENIALACQAEFLQHDSNVFIHAVITDSRSTAVNASSLFFAIKGVNHNGHAFINEMYAKGVRNFVVSEQHVLPTGCNLLLVKDTLVALQQLATFHRQQFSLPTLAITGSNGKTIVKEWLYQLLREDLNIVRSPKSYNSQIGVPLSVLLIQEQHQLAIIEAGISERNEMKKIAACILPTIGILTNIGQAHSENFSTKEEHLNEKLNLFDHCKTLIYCSDDIFIASAIEKRFNKIEKIDWGKQKQAYLHIQSITKMATGTTIVACRQQQTISITIPFSDQASIENAIHCLCFLVYQGIETKILQERFAKLIPIEMRLELINGINNCLLVNDTYNSDFNALRIALEYLSQQKKSTKNTLILSDILQDRMAKEELYAQVNVLLQEEKIDRLIGIGPQLKQHQHLFTIPATFYSSTSEFIRDFQSEHFQNECILIKGARDFRFEQITELLQEKSHETILKINLSALAHNLNYFRKLLEPTTKIMAMVKAFSYGSGSYEIASVMEHQRADYLAVAYTDEGIALRKAGISLPIMVMNPEKKSFAALLRYNLEPEIYCFHLLNEWLNFIQQDKANAASAIHLKIDTGMHRLGFEEHEVDELLLQLNHHPSCKVLSIYSHLVGSEDPSLDAFTREQIDRFTRIATKIERALGYTCIKHLLNTGGISRFPEAQLDMVRLGIGLYGIGHTEETQQQLEVTSSLFTIVSQIKEVPKNETVGYSRKGVLSRDSRIATLPIGYADGYSRQFGNGNAEVLILGKRAKTVGAICMDMCMVDVTDIPEVQEGTAVEVFGKTITVEELAKISHTIPYEILTSVSARVKRVFEQE